mmetsp:Transcript_15673/g.36744  ORF Transcript_15673/g.36744 Transcript_15673/m.36744 type:complete len:743 (+) Transcript_15673:99-2327(+)
MLGLGVTLKPANLPSQDLAFTNCIYANPKDVAHICGGKTTGSLYAEIKGCIFTLQAHPNVVETGIALGKVHREFAKVSMGTDVFVKQFSPPPAFDLGLAALEVDHFMRPSPEAKKQEVQGEELEQIFRQKFATQVLSSGQPIAMEFEGVLLKFQVVSLSGMDLGSAAGGTTTAHKVAAGMLTEHTELEFRNGPSGKLHVLSNKVQQRSIFRPDFNFEELGIGGLSKEFGDIFRRAFAARIFPPQVVRDLGINYVRGMLLYGPPGTGKTLIARQLAKFLKAAEPKIINGPEVLNKYVGQSEENIRKLFADAEKEYKQKGEDSQLHIVIFDEIDAICKQRGAKQDSTGVSDSIVNQLLSKIDGVDALNNILLIGMTNRLDLIDEALLRPGRLEVHVEISLPDENGRVDILNIHTKNMRAKGYLAQDVSMETIATRTKNFSGAELEGLVRSATSFALNRKVSIGDQAKPQDLRSICVTSDDFNQALDEVKPAFGQHIDDLASCVAFGILDYSEDFKHCFETCMSLVEQVRNSANTPLLTCLLSGRSGSGKTALAAHLAQKSDYPFVRRIGAENYVGYSESAKVAAITKVFEDAYKTPLSLILLDDLERLMDYVRIGPRFSNVVLQALFSLLKKAPPKSARRLLVIATTSDEGFLADAELLRAFNVVLQVPVLTTAEHFRLVLSTCQGFNRSVVDEICKSLAASSKLPSIGIKTLLLVAEMAVQQQAEVTKEVFFECLQNTGSLEA